ncbi:hypothetical protein CRG98_000321 [Punica granatum]|uniref:Uncharacterized protein n=1 Tax=Punica granatum TaxID=22663 RepID=A0A2I0LF40_PUNGR|nr:hypothetical protein CRG98_000321 [Punica granatum]
MEGSGSPIGGLDPESTEDLQLRVPDRFGVGAANRRPHPLHHQRSPIDSKSGSTIGDPDPSTEVTDNLCGHRRPRWRGRGRRLAVPTPGPFRFSLLD